MSNHTPTPPPVEHSSSSDSNSTLHGSPHSVHKHLAVASLPHSSPPTLARPRRPSESTIRPTFTDLGEHIARVSSNPLPPPPAGVAALRSRSSSFGRRGRSQSPLRDRIFTWRRQGTDTPPNGEPVSWWNSREPIPRPWEEKRQKTVPPEQTENWERTRHRVAEAAANVLGTAVDVAHEALILSVDVLRFAPVAGLEEAARTLLTIWDALQLVDMNRLACLRLTERCATILMSIREEIAEAGDEVGQELQAPVARLVDIFKQVHRLLQKQNHRPFLKRYLKREEIQRHLAVCDNSLSDALGMFSLSIQIRILKQILNAEQQRKADNAVLNERIAAQEAPRNSLHLTGVDVPMSIISSTTTLNEPEQLREPEQVHATLKEVVTRQNQRDTLYDLADLRQLMRTALQTSNDAEMIRVLQVERDEMPEAIKTLQRALEAEVEKERETEEKEAVETAAVQAQAFAEQEGATRARSQTLTSNSSKASSSSSRSRVSRDTLHREFLESGIDALRRLSRGAEALPSWTITRYEVDRDEKIGIGFFSDVYKGKWRNSTVAIKVLAQTTPRSLFIHEVSIWQKLQHPNVLPLLGASSASSDPPWFFVSPYYKNGSLVTYLKGLPSLDSIDVLKKIHEVAKGMAYLHGEGVLHGDLKAANILVDDRLHCVISDFGQSEMKSEAYRLSGTPPPHGTLRWQAPELMAGQSEFTQEMDVYAFAICCAEILTKGALPWSVQSDEAVRYFVLKENMRPQLPLMRVWSKDLADIIQACWEREPSSRPTFVSIDASVQALRARYGSDLKESPNPPKHELHDMATRKSPSMVPMPLPLLPPDVTVTQSTLPEEQDESESISSKHPRIWIPADSASSSNRSSASMSTPEYEADVRLGFESPLPPDERTAELRDERRYRMLLQHEFHPSLTLPLWSPSPVALGAVGYLSKPTGSFVTLFNSLKPYESIDGLAKNIPSLHGYGRVVRGSSRQDKRNVAQRGMDVINAWLTSRSRGDGRFAQSVSRQYSSPLRSGHKTAHMFTETTNYNYVQDLAAPKRWFTANVDRILELYGATHDIQKEDLFLVIGKLDTPEYALFVSHNHPDGHVNFNVFSSPKAGQPWGEFSTNTNLSTPLLAGPVYEEPVGSMTSASKVSPVRPSSQWDTVLIARLRFKPDVAEPTSL